MCQQNFCTAHLTCFLNRQMSIVHHCPVNYNICGVSDFAICLNTLLFQGFLIWRRKICKALVCCKSVVSGLIWHLFQEFANNIALFWFKMSNREVLNKDESNNYSTSLTPAKFLDCCMLAFLCWPIWHRWIKYQGIWEKKLARYKSLKRFYPGSSYLWKNAEPRRTRW